MKSKIRAIIVNVLSLTIGKLLVLYQPQKIDELSKKGLTNLRNTGRLTWKEKLMRRAILIKAKKNRDVDSLAKFHHNYWVNHGHVFFSLTKNKMKNDYLPEYKSIFNVLHKQLLKESNRFKTLVEIGTGDGSVLNYLSSKFPEINRMVGIDLSEVQIANNKVNYKENPRLEFVAADGFNWVKKHGHEDMVFVTFRGVLEYFTQPRLKDFFNKLNGLGKITFFAIEPNGVKHNFKTNPNSQIYGSECAFSHNYPMLFENAGFKIWHLSKRVEGEHDDITCIIGAKNF